MSLIYAIKARPMIDVINQGARTIFSNILENSDSATLRAGTSERVVAVYSFVVTSDDSSSSRVRLQFFKNSDPDPLILTIFDGYVSSASPVSHSFSFGDEQYGDELYDLRILNDGSAGNIAYTVSARIIGTPTPLGFIENKG